MEEVEGPGALAEEAAQAEEAEEEQAQVQAGVSVPLIFFLCFGQKEGLPNIFSPASGFRLRSGAEAN